MTTADDLAKLRENRSVVPRPTGEIDLFMGDESWLTLRRPRFGEIKSIIRAQRRLQDDLEAAVNESRALQGEIDDQLTELGLSDTKSIRPDHLERISEIQKHARKVATEMEDRTDAAVTAWWVEMLEIILGADKAPGEDVWPGYFTNPSIPGAMVEHWKSVPAGPG